MNISTLTRRRVAGVFATASMVFGLTAAVAAPPSTVPGTYGSIVIGDLPGMMDRGAELGQRVNPGISGDMLRGQLGMMLGDEGLRSIAPGSGLVITIPTAGQPFVLLETAEGKAEDVVNLVKQRLPNASAQAVNDKLIALTMDQAAMENASGAMGTAAAALLENNDDKFIVATIDSDALANDRGAQLHTLFGQLTRRGVGRQAPNTTGTANAAGGNAMAFAGHLLTAAAKRTDVATIKIDISGEGVLFEKTLWPLGGVNLEEPEGQTGQELQKMLPAAQHAIIQYEYYADTRSVLNALKPMIREALTGVGVAAGDQEEVMRVADLAGDSIGDGIAGWLAYNEDGVRGNYLISVTDADKALRYVEEAASSMTTGSMAKMYEGFGMQTSASLTRNARTIDGQPAHSFTMFAEGPGSLAMGVSEADNKKESLITFIENKMLMIIGDVPAEPAVAAVKGGSGSGTELKSRQQLPPDGAFYMDYNMGAVMAGMASQDPEMAQLADTMKDVTIVEAGYVDEESLKFMMKIPGETVTQMVGGFQAMARQGTSQAPPAGTVPRGSVSTGTTEADQTTTDVSESVINVEDDVDTTPTL